MIPAQVEDEPAPAEPADASGTRPARIPPTIPDRRAA
jgi:hypothetical protein